MSATSVTSKGRVTIPNQVRQRLKICRGTRVVFSVVGDHVEMRVESTPIENAASGFGLLKSRRAAVPVGFDPAALAAP